MSFIDNFYANLIGSNFGQWIEKVPFGNEILKIILILFGAWILLRIIRRISKRLIGKVVERKHPLRDHGEVEQRAQTLVNVTNMTARIVIWVMVAFIILSELNIDIAPLLAGAGIAGVAIGFGAQNLVRDFLAGLFIILEDQYAEGDVVNVAGKSGLVEEISLRKTVLRDLDGIEHHIPNGEIKVASNYTKDFSRVNLNLSVAYETDLEKAMNVINQVGQKMAEDEKWQDVITDPPHTLGVDKFGDYAIEIKVLGETKPLKQWDVMREFRKRIKVAFDKNNIEIPYPKRVSLSPKKQE